MATSPAGTLASFPFRVLDGRAYGPGIFDMKAGVAIAIHALKSSRKALDIFRVAVEGRAAHAGNDHQRGSARWRRWPIRC